jgi:hypothetical protein
MSWRVGRSADGSGVDRGPEVVDHWRRCGRAGLALGEQIPVTPPQGLERQVVPVPPCSQRRSSMAQIPVCLYDEMPLSTRSVLAEVSASLEQEVHAGRDHERCCMTD